MSYLDRIPKAVNRIILDKIKGSSSLIYFCDIIKVGVPDLLLERVNAKLKSTFGDKVSKIKRFLNDNKVVLSGSFIIQAILKEDWDSDVDLFCESSKIYPWYDDVIEKVSTLESNLREDVVIDATNDEMYHYLNQHYINHIENYLFSGKIKLQMVEFNLSELYLHNGIYRDCNYGGRHVIDGYPKELEIVVQNASKSRFNKASWDHIKSNFDFDICKCMYYIENGIEYLKIFNLRGLLDKIIDIDQINSFTLHRRIEKYISRGFRFKDYNFPRSIPTPGPLLILKNGLSPDDGNDYNNELYVEVSIDITPGCYQLIAGNPRGYLGANLSGYNRYPGHGDTMIYGLRKIDC